MMMFLLLSLLVQSGDGVLIRLPGTQPGMAAPADSAGACSGCHTAQVSSWRGSAMAHAATDPVFNAMLAVTNARTLPLGLDAAEYCLRCHAPAAWLAGRSHDLSTQHFTPTDLEGVQCDFCHRITDALNPAAGAAVSGPVPGYGNGMYVVMPFGEPRRGSGAAAPAPHPTAPESFLSTSEFCGTCHDVSNPYFAVEPSITPPAHQPALERTYTEWALSWYATRGATGTCQSCHMPSGGTGHSFPGGNIFLLRMMRGILPGEDRGASAGATMDLLRRAVRLEAAAGLTGEGTAVLVRLTNLTGHKLPTGFAEGRRLWLEVTGLDGSGRRMWTSGFYDHGTGTLDEDPQLTVYEARMGPSLAAAAATGLPAEPGYHVALSDSVWFDNRIPPRGFRREAFRAMRAEPVGASYEDGQYWDIRRYILPAGVESVTVRVLLQQVTRSLAEFLRTENAANPYDWNRWGERVYAAWREHGEPVELAAVRLVAGPSAPELNPFRDPLVPLELRLEQNYPNPFNAGTRIRYGVDAPVPDASLVLFDATGRVVDRLLEGRLPAGEGEILYDPRTLASGVYLLQFSSGGIRVSRKIVLIR